MVSRESIDEPQTTVMEDIKAVFKMIVSKQMRFLLPQLMWTGISIAVYTGLLVPIIFGSISDTVDPNIEFSDSMFAMISFGVGEIIGGISMGLIIDRIGTKTACFINIANVINCVSIVILYIMIDEYTWLAYLMTFAWGWMDSCASIHLDAILGFEFESSKEPFSIDSLFEALMVFTFQMIQSIIETQHQMLVYMCCLGVLGVLMTTSTLFFGFRSRNIKNEEFYDDFIIS
jgi:MFS family permease